ncbi:hypothetical protein Csa_020196 [Cucumis sativus]|uniref:Uncharacterized protein n=1 Tax=Cucumis sativus TaxID=3659 RepID=A0A0A0K2N9_CUCSA|nr:hypothetical protein Csa_020196 [Cucumis sativus]
MNGMNQIREFKVYSNEEERKTWLKFSRPVLNQRKKAKYKMKKTPINVLRKILETGANGIFANPELN